MSVCVFCNESVPTRKKLFCSECKCTSHISCVHKTIDVASLLNEVSGLSWKCNSCLKKYISVNQETLNDMINSQIRNALSTLTTVFEGLKSDLTEVIADKISSLSVKTDEPPVSYARTLKNNTLPAVLIKPKDHSQSNIVTRQAVTENIDPVQSKLELSRVKSLGNGSVLIGCKSSEGNQKFKQLAEQQLADSYEIRELKGINPRVRIVGFTDTYDETDLLSILRQLNKDIFFNDSYCEVVKVSKTRKNADRYQAVLQADRDTYDRLVRVGNVFVGYDPCIVYDAVQVSRCFKCNEFNHSATNCSNEQCCPRCGQDHTVNNCQSQILKCSNCIKFNNGNHGNPVNTNHAAWDMSNCTIYRNACAKLKANILGR